MKTIRTLTNGKEHITLISEGYRHEIPERNCIVIDTVQNVLIELRDEGFKRIDIQYVD